MGNCQAVDAAALVIQHPNGKLERIYCPVTASEVMRTNPGHYVSLIIPLPNDDNEVDEENTNSDNRNKAKTVAVRFTRVKLLRPSDTLVLGRAYRLVTAQEVTKVLRENKREKTRRLEKPVESEVDDMKIVNNQENQNNNLIIMTSSDLQSEAGTSMHGNNYQGKRPDMDKERRVTKTWNPSLQSISESSS